MEDRTALDRLFPGRSEMASRMRAMDWSGTTLGDPRRWPEPLQTSVRICLTSRFPIVMYWGADFTVLYNDPYIEFLGDKKHPRALGRPAIEVWNELWPTIGPMLNGVLESGEATWSENLPMFFARRLPLEEVYVTFTFGPIWSADASSVGGIFCACKLVTEQIVAERRLETLRQIGARSLDVRDVRTACDLSLDALSGNPRDVPFAAIYLVDGGSRTVRRVGDVGFSETVPLPAMAALDQASPPWPFADVMQVRAAREVSLAGAGEFRSGPWSDPPTSAVMLPLLVAGQDAPAGLLVCGTSSRRVLDAEYQTFHRLLADQIGRAIGNALGYEAERRRAEALAALDRAKTTFFSNVSHELRTPLTLMMGPLDDILGGGPERVSPQDRDLLLIARRNTSRLLKLVNTLLEFSRIEAGRLQARYEPTDLAALTADLASNFRAACERGGVRLVVDCPPLPERAYVDRDMWERIVLNLVSNAFKFTLDGEIVVHLRSSDGMAELTVSDTGAGIPQAELTAVFERFRRIEGTRGRTQEGTGIGLALVLELVKLHGGTVRVTSTEGEGSTFSVRVPFGSAHLAADRIVESAAGGAVSSRAVAYVDEALSWLGNAPDALAAEEAASAPAPGRRARVLLADDNHDMRQYVRKLLAVRHDVETAANGAQALEMIRRDRPDLVISDVMMPVLDGFDLLRAVREAEETRTTPILLLSARAGEEARIEGLQAGADDYLVKPFSARELVARVEALLALSRVRRESQRILAGISDGFVAFDRDWRYTYVNDAAGRMLGRKPDHLLGRQVWQVFPESAGAHLQQELERSLRDDVPVELEHFDPERDRWYQIRAYPTEDGLSMYFVDITARKGAEDALRESDRRKDEFLATLAHELRNPLAPVRLATEVLRRTTSEEQAGLARDVIDRQVTTMARLIDDLMDVSRISFGKIELRREPIELTDVLNQALETSRPLLEEAGQELVLELPGTPMRLHADPMRVAQVLANLVDNASKHSLRGGRIWMRACQLDGQAVVRVRDEGAGINADMLGKVWDMFAQGGGPMERAGGGLGIGLTLARTLVELHGGTVEARSEGPGHGAEFVIRLPTIDAAAYERAREEISVRNADAIEGADRPRVLVADDNEDAARSLATYLELVGCDVRTAHDGSAALGVAERFRPDVALLDLGMPGLNGFELARLIRKTSWGRRMTLVAVTGWGQEPVRDRSRDAGFDRHLVKPVAPEIIHGLLRELRTGAAEAQAPDPLRH